MQAQQAAQQLQAGTGSLRRQPSQPATQGIGMACSCCMTHHPAQSQDECAGLGCAIEAGVDAQLLGEGQREAEEAKAGSVVGQDGSRERWDSVRLDCDPHKVNHNVAAVQERTWRLSF